MKRVDLKLNKKKLDGRKLKIGLVVSLFNTEITHGLLKGCLEGLKENGVKKQNIVIQEVPGSFEIPLAAQRLARTRKFQAIICLGAIIKGETAHWDYLAQAVSWGIMKLSLENNMPVLFGVLTCQNLKQAQVRSGPNKNNKGYLVAREAIFAANNFSK